MGGKLKPTVVGVRRKLDNSPRTERRSSPRVKYQGKVRLKAIIKAGMKPYRASGDLSFRHTHRGAALRLVGNLGGSWKNMMYAEIMKAGIGR